nr:E3 ubiquitin-protein ligase FANCL-like [Leptinotarsa decemlineata]XP_023015193.1 E3 ubiquitin-protein ligase FANCL-like [Leptinotarsa decemlineata]XP_023015194.1 E3 ubiquitin-protein ligase FANCL-like [Leptinotarsa decemlineata]XP_023015195.1 E3 ubiquitin-protein ligase FANCL-like [Leptinotarsa decemlineata]XP_023015196.1 E3 ubiquitin-protein ligase FANCL-like [Leptinotarsa decemlineata]XP_023015197.1 E3 ubiquitin-protein ligase FANCL-like [Leptinotarsa decemlineata]XP_023015198.1 E3 ubiqu
MMNINPVDKDEIELLLNYPLMSKSLQDGTITYSGFIEINNTDYKVSVQQVSEKTFVLHLPHNLKHLKRKFSNIMQQQSTNSIVSYLDSLTVYIKSKIPSSEPSTHCDIYKQVLHEYYELTRFYVNLKKCHLARDLSKINISTEDDQNRTHSVEITVNYENKDIFQITDYDLPQDKDTLKASSNLREVYEQFHRSVDNLQSFFNLMEVVDTNSCILDPVHPKKRHNYRRIWIGENISMILTVDPLNVSRIPEIKFLGPEPLVEAYRTTINGNLKKWDQNNDTFSEILHLIGITEFPQKKATVNVGDDLLIMSGDCNICYSSRLNDKLPEIICKNKFCENYYHTECLYEWLMSVNARRFFTEVIGNCPNCEKNITCPIPSQMT